MKTSAYESVCRASSVAILSDIHGNVRALKAVLRDLEKHQVEQIVLGGDYAFHGPEPDATLKLLAELNCPAVVGNTDQYILSEEPKYLEHPGVQWCRAACSKEALVWLAAVTDIRLRIRPPESERLEDDLLLFHATPNDPNALLIFDDENPLPFAATGPEELRMLVGDASANLMVYGHIHYASTGMVDGRRLASLGAVGFPFDGDRRAAYATARWDGAQWCLEHHRVAYDVDQVVTDVKACGNPHSEVLAKRLEEARFFALPRPSD